MKTYVVIPHLNHLVETVLMGGHNIWFQREKRKIIPQLSSNTPLLSRAVIDEMYTSSESNFTFISLPSFDLDKCVYWGPGIQT